MHIVATHALQLRIAILTYNPWPTTPWRTAVGEGKWPWHLKPHWHLAEWTDSGPPFAPEALPLVHRTPETTKELHWMKSLYGKLPPIRNLVFLSILYLLQSQLNLIQTSFDIEQSGKRVHILSYLERSSIVTVRLKYAPSFPSNDLRFLYAIKSSLAGLFQLALFINGRVFLNKIIRTFVMTS